MSDEKYAARTSGSERILSRPRIAVIHPLLAAGGGSESRALRLVEALKENYDVDLLTMGDVGLDQLNLSYGTHLVPEEFSIIGLPFPPLIGDRFDAWKAIPLSRFCLRHSNRYDVMISAYNVMNFGRPGIQYIADFSFDDRLRRDFHGDQQRTRSLLYRPSLLRSLYLRWGKLLAGTNDRDWRKNVTVANSLWTREILRRRLGIDSQVVYPPVAGDFPDIAWEEKENGFVCLGRINPQKRIHKVIEILAGVREKGHGVHLHIVGRTDDRSYERVLKQLCERHQPWATFDGPLFGRAKEEFLARHRYGISACRNESFGIATAEMVKAGCLVFVPRQGGQIEIVSEEELIYESVAEAAEKAGRVLESRETQLRLREQLAETARGFSVQRFREESLSIVGRFLGRKEEGA